MTIYVQRKTIIGTYLSKIFLPLFALLAIVFVCGYQLLDSVNNPEINEKSDLPGLNLHDKASGNTRKKRMVDIKAVNFLSPDYPSSIDSEANNVAVTTSSIIVMGVDTFYREALPPTGVQKSNQMVLLLHGAAFKSETWLNLKTINILAAMGHHVIAVDLPGYGETTHPNPNIDKGDYLKTLIASLKLSNFVLVSPSMSGSFSVPYLIRNHRDVDGFVPVAPVSTGALVGEGPKIITPTLIVYGQLDQGLGVTSAAHLSNLPNHQTVVLPNAKHPAYLDQPKMFHTLLYNFLKTLKG